MIAALKEIKARQSGKRAWRNMYPPNVPLTSDQADALWQAYSTVVGYSSGIVFRGQDRTVHFEFRSKKPAFALFAGTCAA